MADGRTRWVKETVDGSRGVGKDADLAACTEWGRALNVGELGGRRIFLASSTGGRKADLTISCQVSQVISRTRARRGAVFSP